MQSVIRPIPSPDDLTKPFWDAAKERRLAIQRCQDCGYYQHPPQVICMRCRSGNLGFDTVSGRGTIYSYTVMHDTRVKAFEPAIPYLVIIVELEEQPGLVLVSNLAGVAPGDVKVGMPVQVTFEDAQSYILPQFTLVR